MSTKECDHHREKREKRLKCWCTSIIGFVVVVAIVLVIGWAIIKPKNPRFIIQDATFYNFTVNSSPDLFTNIFQITIFARNPNDKVGIYYDHLNAYATYRDQPVSLFTCIPSTYQGHKESVIWSPFIEGTSIPISPLNAYALNQDQASGTIPILIRIVGKVRWKFSTYISKSYALHVACPTNIPYGVESQGNVVAETSIKYQLSLNCQVSS